MIEFKAQDGCCEEASMYSKEFYIPCNATAKHFMYSDRDKRTYRMCEPCAYHNLKRGMVDVTKVDGKEIPEYNEELK